MVTNLLSILLPALQKLDTISNAIVVCSSSTFVKDLLQSSLANQSRISMETGTKVCTEKHGHMAKMIAMPMCGRIPFPPIFSSPEPLRRASSAPVRCPPFSKIFSKLLSQSKPNFMWGLLWEGERTFKYRMVMVT